MEGKKPYQTIKLVAELMETEGISDSGAVVFWWHQGNIVWTGVTKGFDESVLDVMLKMTEDRESKTTPTKDQAADEEEPDIQAPPGWVVLHYGSHDYPVALQICNISEVGFYKGDCGKTIIGMVGSSADDGAIVKETYAEVMAAIAKSQGNAHVLTTVETCEIQSDTADNSCPSCQEPMGQPRAFTMTGKCSCCGEAVEWTATGRWRKKQGANNV